MEVKVEISNENKYISFSIGNWMAIRFEPHPRKSYDRRLPQNRAVYVWVNDISPKIGRSIGASVSIQQAVKYLEYMGAEQHIPDLVHMLIDQGWQAEIPLDYQDGVQRLF